MKTNNSWRIVDRVINESDILLEIVDARMPNLTRNRKVENKIRQRRKILIIVMNKSDLITRRMREDFLRDSESEEVIFVSSKDRAGIASLKKMIVSMARRIRYKDYVRVGVVGYPNTGKSSVINVLVGKSSARTSPIAGMTTGVQMIRGESHVMFLDTPGVIPSNENDEAEQALMCIIDPNKIVNPDIAAMKIIQLFLDCNRKALERLYGVKIDNEDAFGILLEIGKKKNLLRKGNRVDEVRTSLTIIRDWQSGKLLLNLA